MKTVSDLEFEFKQALSYRAPWNTEWKKITEYLLPGRGIYNLYNKPRIRKFSSPKVINTKARGAVQVLTSGLHGGLTSPSIQWLDLNLSNPELLKIKPISEWLYECKNAFYTAISESSFYQIMPTFYTELVGFGNAVMYCGEAEDALDFELLTAGEYAFTLDVNGRVNTIFRVVYKTYIGIVNLFGEENVSEHIRKQASENPYDTTYINQAVYPEEFMDKPFTSIYWEPGSSVELERKGYYEFPYAAARWETIGSDIYAVGLGSHALPDVMRLQEMEKSFLTAAHKAVDPPLNVPIKLKGKVKTYPNALNYYTNPQEQVNPLMNVRYDFMGLSAAIERAEDRISDIFFNDIFLTAARDPNASPLKATEVRERKEEKLLRLGPVIGRILHEFITPLVSRCFNILSRQNKLPTLPQEYAELVKDYSVSFVSPLAQSQKLIASQPINNFLQFIVGAAQIEPTVLDNIDADKLVAEYADLTGVPKIILRSEAEILQRRKQREEQLRQQRAKEEAILQQQMQVEQDKQRSEIAQNYSEAGMNFNESVGSTGYV